MKTSGSKRIAQRYVRALFEVATDGNALAQVEQDLASLEQALSGSEEFRHFLSNPLLSRNQQAEAMLAILEKIHVDQVTRQFIGMLVAQKRLEILPDVIDVFSKWASAARGELNAELISAAPMKVQEIALVSDRLSKAYGKKTNLEVRQDPSLLGGVILKIGSQQLDSSLAGKMRRLKNALQSA